ncbi:MAG: DUF4198 domain-containing protein [Oxalicibacterium faecigallinarum]|uniref:DUF4198 domain-containing protein n=1 Tax=Oxalicibacterium faecigallinarum TaxID=573741 RepID=UPI00280808EB|nr:DUF4198 domain-containing protein [Oxalicibacterium faecigallinarum]MDQ7968848.1 DUF4198 domain-containing protein [Oxalicibacterium faecigallinarum]
MKRLALLPLISALMFAGSAQAHQVWLEQNAKSASLYFGEFGENLRETSPGLLDKFVKPSATLIGAKSEQALTLTKGEKSYVLSGRAGKNETIYAEEANYPVIERKEGDKVVSRMIWTPAARLITSNAAVEPKLTLDIVPTGKQGEFKVTYKGQPLPKAKVGIIVQSGWGKEAYSDEQGLVDFDTPWAGTYVLEVHHTDKTPGERNGAAYDSASFVTTLSLTQPTGVKALPAPPAATPNK